MARNIKYEKFQNEDLQIINKKENDSTDIELRLFEQLIKPIHNVATYTNK